MSNTSGKLTAAAQAVTLEGLTGYNRVMCGVYCPSTDQYAGARIIVEGSADGTTWKALPVVNMESKAAEVGEIALRDGESRGWSSQASGNWTKVRVRCVAITSGTVHAGIDAQPEIGQPPRIVAVPEILDSTGGRFSKAVAAGAGTAAVVACPAPARLCKVIVTDVPGTPAAMKIYDNESAASGDVLFQVPSTATLGTVYDPQCPAAKGITAGQVTNSIGVLLSYTPIV